MKQLILLTGIVLSLNCAAQAGLGKSDVVPGQLRCEYRENPLGIDVEKPRLSWVSEARGTRAEIRDPKSEVRGQMQTAY